MAIFGVITEHTTPADGNRVNRWYVSADTISDAIDSGNVLVDVMLPVFGTLVTFVKIHAWVPGQSPNQFVTLNISKPGTYTATNPTSAIQCSRVQFTAGVGSYPNYKDLRICINPDQQVGRGWNSSFSGVMEDLLEGLDGLGFITTKTGTPLTAPSWVNEVFYRQLSKRWHNRAS